jgi:hypothetical protein
MPRKNTDNVVKGEGIHLVGLRTIFAHWKELKVLKDMKAAYVFCLQRNDMVNIKAGRTAFDEIIDPAHVCPRRDGTTLHGPPL